MGNSPFTLGRSKKHRAPDWRWRLAVHLAEHPDDLAAQACADLWVVQPLLFLRDPPAAARPSPDPLRTAGRIYVADHLSRSAVEAHLLLGEPLEQVASRCGVARGVLATYREVFFDIRGRDQASDYVVGHLIGLKALVGLSEDEQGIVVKLAGYRGRGDLIRGLVSHFRSPPLTSKDFDVSGLDSVYALRDRLVVKSWVVEQTLPCNELMVLAMDALEGVEKLLALPADGRGVVVEAAAARLRRANSVLDELRACIASARKAALAASTAVTP